MPKDKPLLLETIKVENGIISNLKYHQKRCDKSRLDLYDTKESLCLKSSIQPPPKGLYRCRILYTTKIHSIEYIPYQEKKIHSLRVINIPLDYAYKYANRDTLNALVSQYTETDEILIEHKGYIQDTSIANIAFYSKGVWFTPSRPLLEGTMREKLLDEGFLVKKDIRKEDLSSYSQVALMNAMIGFIILKNIKIYSEEGICYDY